MTVYTFKSVTTEIEAYTHTLDHATTRMLSIHSVESLKSLSLLLFQMLTLNYLLLNQIICCFFALHLFARIQIEEFQFWQIQNFRDI